MFQIEPMSTWPYRETRQRRQSAFTASWSDTRALLERELQAVDLRGAAALRLVTTDTAAVRRDGMLRRDARVLHPGVALSFTCRHGALTYPCDAFVGSSRGLASWQANVRAIALGLEALRKVDRYGIAGLGEQYDGWRQIGAGTGAAETTPFASAAEALAWVQRQCGEPEAPAKRAMRLASLKLHPDVGGDRAMWDRLEQARAILDRSGLL